MTMPIIDVTLFEGRDLETRRALVKELTLVAAQRLEVPEAAVTVVLREVRPDLFAEGGELLSDRRERGD